MLAALASNAVHLAVAAHTSLPSQQHGPALGSGDCNQNAYVDPTLSTVKPTDEDSTLRQTETKMLFKRATWQDAAGVGKEDSHSNELALPRAFAAGWPEAGETIIAFWRAKCSSQLHPKPWWKQREEKGRK